MPTDWSEWEVATQPSAAAQPLSPAPLPAPTPAPQPQGSSFMDFLRGVPSSPESPGYPGLLSRIGTAASTVPAALNPLLAGATDIAAVAGAAQPWLTNTLMPTVGAASRFYPPNLLARGLGSAAGYLEGRAEPYIRRGLGAGWDLLTRGAEAAIGGPEAASAWGQVFNPSPALPQDMPPAGPVMPMAAPRDNPMAPPIGLPPAPLDPQQRAVGRIYMTPAGPRKWMGNGWARLQ